MAITARTCFNPRTPCGVRPVTPGAIRRTYRFQSTHSLRSATGEPTTKQTKNMFQSTHSLRSATLPVAFLLWSSCRFNPRTPCGVRPDGDRVKVYLKGFQSTHSLRSATRIDRAGAKSNTVSIHALLAECDPPSLYHSGRLFRFNPRTPCGVRHGCNVNGIGL